LTAANATNAALTAQLATANTTIAALQTQLTAANGTIASLQMQLTTCNASLAAANQTLLTLQNEITELVQPLHLLTEDFRTTFRDSQFVIPGDNAVEQMQNLLNEIMDFPRGLKQPLFLSLGGHLSFLHRPGDPVGVPAQ
jgi:septal ring factor EnvC (AmiA/AmiB activator)